MCPDTDSELLNEYFVIKNGYTNRTERLSFSIEIHKCNDRYNPECKPNEEIVDLLDKIYFNFYML